MPLTIIKKSSTLDVHSVLNQSLIYQTFKSCLSFLNVAKFSKNYKQKTAT